MKVSVDLTDDLIAELTGEILKESILQDLEVGDDWCTTVPAMITVYEYYNGKDKTKKLIHDCYEYLESIISEHSIDESKEYFTDLIGGKYL